MIPYSWLNVFSSTFFFTNAYRLSYKPEHTSYCYTFTLLACSSSLHHAMPEIALLNYIDKIAAYGVVYYGGEAFYKYLTADSRNIYSLPSIINIVAFGTVIWLYVYGYFAGKYSFDTNGWANIYHVGMHGLSSLGHHCIICLL